MIATIVDLARRGYLEMTDTKRDGIFAKAETIFTRTKPLDDLKGSRRRWPTRSSTAAIPTR